MFIPPLGYMLKFSGSADLHEHVHPALRKWKVIAIQRHRRLVCNGRTEMSPDNRATALLWMILQIAPTLRGEPRSWRPNEPQSELHSLSARSIVQYSKNGGRDVPPARFTFKNHLVLDPLQITMHIAVRYVLHRQPSRNIIY